MDFYNFLQRRQAHDEARFPPLPPPLPLPLPLTTPAVLCWTRFALDQSLTLGALGGQKFYKAWPEKIHGADKWGHFLQV